MTFVCLLTHLQSIQGFPSPANRICSFPVILCLSTSDLTENLGVNVDFWTHYKKFLEGRQTYEFLPELGSYVLIF